MAECFVLYLAGHNRPPHEVPALRWKLANLETFRKRRPGDFAAQAKALDEGLGLGAGDFGN